MKAAPPLVELSDVLEAGERLRAVMVRTPMLAFDDRAWLKAESLHPIGSFKLRGAYNAIAKLTPERRDAGLVTHSSGNHAQGVARAARLLGARATIVMPSDVQAVKIARVRADQAEIVIVGPSSEERLERANALAKEEGLTLVTADIADVVAGQGTCGLEIVEQIREIDESVASTELDPTGLTVLVPVGSGGLAAGIATAVKSLRPEARVFGVEPELAADAQESLLQGRIIRVDPSKAGQTIADGMRGSLGQLPFAQLSRYLDGIVTVTEGEIARAMVRAADEAHLVLEPSGATALAAWLFHADQLPRDGRVVCVLSGGNIDPQRYAALMAEGRAYGG
jgi:threonine dehydratase